MYSFGCIVPINLNFNPWNVQREGRPVDVSLRKGVHFVVGCMDRFIKQNVCQFKPRRVNTEMTFGGEVKCL